MKQTYNKSELKEILNYVQRINGAVYPEDLRQFNQEALNYLIKNNQLVQNPDGFISLG